MSELAKKQWKFNCFYLHGGVWEMAKFVGLLLDFELVTMLSLGIINIENGVNISGHYVMVVT